MNQRAVDNTMIDIESQLWRLQLHPGLGLQTQTCKIQHAGDWHDIMPDCSAADAPLSAGNFHMLPYSNRIRDGRFSHAGSTVQLNHAEQHAIHGALRKRPWQVTARTNNSATAQYDSRTDGNINWPWPILATVSYTLTNDTLITQMTLTNHGGSSMPAGMGWHPYFCRIVAGAHPSLTIAAGGMYPDTDGDCLPTGPAISLPNSLNFATARDLDPDERMDHCLAGFVTPATIAWPDAGITLEMHASNNCTHLVLFNPDEPYFAVEPVTNANDGVNLTTMGIDAGVVDLAPGETLRAEMKLKLVNQPD